MAVTTEVIENSYTASAAQEEFVFTFPVHEESWLKVYQNGALLVFETDYTIEGLDEDDGGTVTLVEPAEEDDAIVLTLDIPITQETIYTYNSKFPEAAHENALDKLTLICLLLSARIDLIGDVVERGNEAIGSGEWEVSITFETAAENDDYHVYLSPSWNSNGWWISNKTTTGFKANFATSPSSSASFDWRVDASA